MSCHQTKEAFEKKNDGQLQNKSVRNAVGVFFGQKKVAMQSMTPKMQ